MASRLPPIFTSARTRTRTFVGVAQATVLATEYDHTLNNVTEVGKSAREDLEYANGHGIDQIVLGSHGRSSIDRALLGGVAETVTRRARIPVTIIG